MPQYDFDNQNMEVARRGAVAAQFCLRHFKVKLDLIKEVQIV